MMIDVVIFNVDKIKLMCSLLKVMISDEIMINYVNALNKREFEK